jgi:hypothetical protein
MLLLLLLLLLRAGPLGAQLSRSVAQSRAQPGADGPDAGDLETGVGAIDGVFRWFARHNPGRWEGGRYAEGSSPAEVLGMLRRHSAAGGAEAARPVRLWTHGVPGVADRTFADAAAAARWIEQQAHAICCWTAPQVRGGGGGDHPPGTLVVVGGLSRAPQHNGRRGRILHRQPGPAGRYVVALPELAGGGGGSGGGAPSQLAVKPDNLCVVSEYAALASSEHEAGGGGRRRQSYLPAHGQASTALDTAADDDDDGGAAAAAAAAAAGDWDPTAAGDARQQQQRRRRRRRQAPDDPELVSEPEALQWRVGDTALYRSGGGGGGGGATIISVSVVGVIAMAAGELPSVIVRMPDGGERDTTPARLIKPEGAPPPPAAPPPSSSAAAPPAAAEGGGARGVRPQCYGYEWREVPAGEHVPPGLAYTLPLGPDQPRRARIPPLWQLQLWCEPAEAFYRLEVTDSDTHTHHRQTDRQTD